MKIQKGKNIRIKITWVTSFGIIFSVALCYFLGWDFEIKSFSIAVGILVALLSALWLLIYILIKREQKYFVIETERIMLYRKNEILCELKKTEMIEMCYVRFFWAFMMQMGSGYLQITCKAEALTDKKFAEIIMPNGIAVFEISMSTKQAKECAKILGKELLIH